MPKVTAKALNQSVAASSTITVAMLLLPPLPPPPPPLPLPLLLLLLPSLPPPPLLPLPLSFSPCHMAILRYNHLSLRSEHPRTLMVHLLVWLVIQLWQHHGATVKPRLATVCRRWHTVHPLMHIRHFLSFSLLMAILLMTALHLHHLHVMVFALVAHPHLRSMIIAHHRRLSWACRLMTSASGMGYQMG